MSKCILYNPSSVGLPYVFFCFKNKKREVGVASLPLLMFGAAALQGTPLTLGFT